MLLLREFWPVIWRAIAAAMIAAALWWAWHAFTDHYREQGRAELRPVVARCEKERDDAKAANATLAQDVEKLRQSYKLQSDRVASLKLENGLALKKKDAALAAMVEKQKSLTVQIEKFQAIVGGPPAKTKEEACDEADRILDELAAERVRD